MNQSEGSLYRTLIRVLYFTVGLAVLLWFLFLIEPVLLASLLALIFAVALNAPVQWMEQKNLPRPLAILIAFVAVLGLAGLSAWLIVPRMLAEVPKLIEQVPQIIERIVAQLTAVIGDNPAIEQQMTRVVDWLLGLFDGLWRYTGDLFAALAMSIFILALALYMVVYLPDLLRWYIRSMPVRMRDPATQAFAQASRMVIGWVIGTVILGGIKFVAMLIFLSLTGVSGAFVWSVLSFIGAFVPRIGFYLVTIPPVVVAFSQDPMLALWTLVYSMAVSEILGDFVAPRIFAGAMEMNAVFILFMTLAMGYAFGLIGVLIASPVAGIVKAYYDAFYLARQPEEPAMKERVAAMMRRDVGWKGSTD